MEAQACLEHKRMNKFDADFLLRRKYYRERRNTVRRLFFFVFLIFFFCSVYYTVQIPTKKSVSIELSKNHLVNNEYIVQSISKQITGKNFFFISPKTITKNLLLSCGLLKDVVIRKYLLPELKLIVFVKEKQLWGKLLSDNGLMYITNEGNLVNGNYINVNLLPANLLLIFCSNTKLISESTLLTLKETLDFFQANLKIKINKFLITDRNTLEIYTDNFIKIDAGYIDATLPEKITKLTDILKQIKNKSYLIRYIDLSLENGAVIKKADEKEIDKKEIDKKVHKLFMILH